MSFSNAKYWGERSKNQLGYAVRELKTSMDYLAHGKLANPRLQNQFDQVGQLLKKIADTIDLTVSQREEVEKIVEGRPEEETKK